MLGIVFNYIIIQKQPQRNKFNAIIEGLRVKFAFYFT